MHKNKGKQFKQHKQTNSRTWWSWISMIKRCYYPKDKCFYLYGGRGISVCDRWKDFRNFWHDMGDRPSKCSLDRINPHGNYTIENCKWSNPKEQGRNRRLTKRYTVNGFTGCITEISEKFNVPVYLLSQRLERGWTIKDAVFVKPRKFLSDKQQHAIISLSKKASIDCIAKLFNAKPSTVYNVIWRHKH